MEGKTMTGKDLIVYILRHNLENEEVLKDGIFVCFLNEKQAAAKFEVGVETIKVWYALGLLEGFEIDEHLYFSRDLEDPRKQ